MKRVTIVTVKDKKVVINLGEADPDQGIEETIGREEMILAQRPEILKKEIRGTLERVQRERLLKKRM